MKLKNRFAGILLMALSVSLSCKKSSTGGDATITVFSKHHTQPIKGCTVYVKFDTQELPSNPTGNYDLKVTGAANEEPVLIEGLRHGKYYLYAEGYDNSISHIVRGGIPVTIKWSERKKEINLNVPVTE